MTGIKKSVLASLLVMGNLGMIGRYKKISSYKLACRTDFFISANHSNLHNVNCFKMEFFSAKSDCSTLKINSSILEGLPSLA